MIAPGMLSSFLPPRAARSRARCWSHRITPVVLVPAPASGTAKPAVRAKFPPLVIGRTTGSFVIRLKASGDTISTGRRPFCSCPEVGSRLTSQISPRFIRPVSLDELTAHGLTIEPFLLFLFCASLGSPRLGIALGEQLVQGIPAPLLRLHNETATFNRDADLGARLQV